MADPPDVSYKRALSALGRSKRTLFRGADIPRNVRIPSSVRSIRVLSEAMDTGGTTRSALRSVDTSDDLAFPLTDPITRFLEALAWQDVKSSVTWRRRIYTGNVKDILNRYAVPIADIAAMRLYCALPDAPAGKVRALVLSNLIPLLADEENVEVLDTLWEGNLVEALFPADLAAIIEGAARRLERALVQSPYTSERALIGTISEALNEEELRVRLARPREKTVHGDPDAVSQNRRHLLTVVDLPTEATA